MWLRLEAEGKYDSRDIDLKFTWKPSLFQYWVWLQVKNSFTNMLMSRCETSYDEMSVVAPSYSLGKPFKFSDIWKQA